MSSTTLNSMPSTSQPSRLTDIAGTSFGLASFHFETKERLFETVLMHLAEEHRVFWQNRYLDASLSRTDRLMAIIDSRFHSRISDRKKLAIWFAFWGDAGREGSTAVASPPPTTILS